MEIKILQVFYDKNGLPYKDKERTVHYPITSGTFLGASNTTQIRFYYDQLDELNESTFVAVSKLPNGKIGSEILESAFDEELNENYATLSLSQFYTQYKGDVFISLQGYQGGVRVEQDEDGIYQIYGTPTIQATGSIKLSIAYAPTFIGSGQTENITLQRVLAELSTKLGIRQETLHVEELPTVGNQNVWYVVNDDPNNPNLANIYVWNSETRHYIWVGDNTLDLGNYYTKQEGKDFEEEINANIATLSQNAFEKVDTTTYATLESFLASTGQNGKIYLYPINLSDLSEGFYQYIWSNNSWVLLGTTEIDLSQYLETKYYINQYWYDTFLTDLNDVVENCVYYITDNNACAIENKPSYFRADDHNSQIVFYCLRTKYQTDNFVLLQVWHSLTDNKVLIRTKEGSNSWTNWAELGNKFSNYLLNEYNYTRIMSDLNNAEPNKTYFCNLANSTYSNLPSGVSSGNVVITTYTMYYNYSTQVLYQTLFSIEKNKTYYRTKSGSYAWGSWNEITGETVYDGYFINFYSYSANLTDLDNAQKGKTYWLSGIQDFYSNVSHLPSGVNTGVALLTTYREWYSSSGGLECLVQRFEWLSSNKAYSRTKIGTGTWSAWSEDGASSAISVTWLNTDQYMNYVTDWNNVKEAKQYFVANSTVWSGISNGPTGVSGQGIFISYKNNYNASTYAVTQVALCGSVIYSRTYQSNTNTWSSWSSSITRTKITIGTGGDYNDLYTGMAAAFEKGNCDVYILDGTYDVTSSVTSIINGDIKLGKNNRYFFSSNSKVICNYTGSNEDIIRENSIFRAYGTWGDFEIYNLTAEGSNIRYIFHDECGGGSPDSTSSVPYRHLFKGCKMKLDNEDSVLGSTHYHCIGGGLGINGCIEIDSCIFESTSVPEGQADCQYHGNWEDNASTQAGKSNIVVKNSYFAHTFAVSTPNPETQKKQLIICGNSFAYDFVNNGSSAYWDVYKWNNEIRGS